MNDWEEDEFVGVQVDYDDYDREITFAEALGVLLMFGIVLGGVLVIAGNMIGAW